MSAEDFIIAVYCLVDDVMKELLKGKDLRQRGFNPALTDSEMITMELVAEYQRIDTDKGAWEYFCNHWHDLFPNLGSRANCSGQPKLDNYRSLLHYCLSECLLLFRASLTGIE